LTSDIKNVIINYELKQIKKYLEENKMKCYIVIKNSIGCDIATFEVDEKKPIANELIRVLKENFVILYEGDTIHFISE
jgi:hypothetical protein